MRLLVAITQAFNANVSVNLRGCEIGVAEQLLHRAKVGTAVEQVGRKSVAQGVRPEWSASTSERQGRQIFGYQIKNLAHAYALAFGGEQQSVAAVFVHKSRSPLLQPKVKRPARWLAVGNHALLVAFAIDAQEPALVVDAGEV